MFVTHLTHREVNRGWKAIDGHAFVRSGFTGRVEVVLRLARVESQLHHRGAARGLIALALLAVLAVIVLF